MSALIYYPGIKAVIWPQRVTEYYVTTTNNRFFDFNPSLSADQSTFSSIKNNLIGNNHPLPLYCLGPDGTSIAAGSSKNYYQSTSVPCGSSCTYETRSCSTAGALSTSSNGYTITSCLVGSCSGSLTNNLIHLWRFNEAASTYISGTAALKDSISPAYDITMYGSISQGTWSGGTNAVFGGGSSTYATVPTSS